jgi:hypothetical protein
MTSTHEKQKNGGEWRGMVGEWWEWWEMVVSGGSGGSGGEWRDCRENVKTVVVVSLLFYSLDIDRH